MLLAIECPPTEFAVAPHAAALPTPPPLAVANTAPLRQGFNQASHETPNRMVSFSLLGSISPASTALVEPARGQLDRDGRTEQYAEQQPGPVKRLTTHQETGGKNTSVRTSMLSRGGAPGASGFSNDI
jgi:hypothetical protein